MMAGRPDGDAGGGDAVRVSASPVAGHPTTAILLAPTPASFSVVAGLPVIQRAALSALRSGFASVIALGGPDPRRLRAVFARDPRTRAIAVVSGEVGRMVTTDRVALIPSDCLVTPATLRRVQEASWNGRPWLFQASGPSAIGHGIVLCSRESWRALDPGIDTTSAEAAARIDPEPTSVFFEGELCLRIPDGSAAAAAEARLVSDLRASTVDTDGPIARFDRALSIRLSRILVKTSLRPNHITTVGTLMGLSGAWSFARGTYAGGILGALLFWGAVILDGCDGEVARLTFQETRWGGVYDVATDNLVHAAVFIGLGVGQYRSVPGWNYGRLIGLLLGGFACALIATYVCLLRHPPVARLRPRSLKGKVRQWLLRGFEALMNRDFAYALIPLALIDRLGWFVWGAAFGTYAYAAGLAWVYRWRDAA